VRGDRCGSASLPGGRACPRGRCATTSGLALVVPGRSGNGYRDYGDSHLRVVAKIRDLAGGGGAPGRAALSVECLYAGHEHSDDCPAALAAYRDSIAEVDRVITSLAARRQRLVRTLEEGAAQLCKGATRDD
jgi:hypothetical protein